MPTSELQQNAKQTWEQFCEDLKAAGSQLIREDLPLDELDAAEGLRYLSRLLRTDLDLQVDSEKAALFGVPAIEVDRTVRLAVAGLPAASFREPDGDEYDITLRLPIQGRPTLGLLDEIQVSSLTGAQVPLAQVTNPEFRTAPNVITRYGRERSISITAYPKTGYVTDDITPSVMAELAGMVHDAGDESFAELLRGINLTTRARELDEIRVGTAQGRHKGRGSDRWRRMDRGETRRRC